MFGVSQSCHYGEEVGNWVHLPCFGLNLLGFRFGVFGSRDVIISRIMYIMGNYTFNFVSVTYIDFLISNIK